MVVIMEHHVQEYKVFSFRQLTNGRSLAVM